MLHLVTLRKVDGTTVIAFVEARTEEEAKVKALNTANNIAKNNDSRILMTDTPLKAIEVEKWDTESKRVVRGNKKYGVLVVTQGGKVEDVVKVAGEKSAYNFVIQKLGLKGTEARVFIFYLNQIRDIDKNGNIEITIEEAVKEKRISFKEFYEVLQNARLADSDNINGTEILEQYIEEMEEADVQVAHMREALEQGSRTDLWEVWLGSSMETPRPLETKEDLVEVLDLRREELKKVMRFNIHNR